MDADKLVNLFEDGTWWVEIPSIDLGEKLKDLDRPVISSAAIAEKEMEKRHSQEYSDLMESIRVKHKDFESYWKEFEPLAYELSRSQEAERLSLPKRCFHSYWRMHQGYQDLEKYGCICDPLEIECIKKLQKEKDEKSLKEYEDIEAEYSAKFSKE